jgi:Ser/Thr protein kinase RdoA (MazF antagonist)
MHDLLVTQLVEHYHLNKPQLVHLGTVWNTTYRITEADGACYNLRLCHPRIQDQSSLLAELAFVAYITKYQHLRVPQPIVKRRGELVTSITTSDGQQLCCLFSWIEGHEARGRLSPSIMEQIGRSMAMLHIAAQAYPFPTPGDGFREGYCYDEGLVSSHSEWIMQHATTLGNERVVLLQTAVAYLLTALASIGKSRANYGVIHADLHLGDFIVTGDTIAVIDFDQVGRGHFCYDIALLMIELLHEEPSILARIGTASKRAIKQLRHCLIPKNTSSSHLHLGSIWFFWMPTIIRGRQQDAHSMGIAWMQPMSRFVVGWRTIRSSTSRKAANEAARHRYWRALPANPPINLIASGVRI